MMQPIAVQYLPLAPAHFTAVIALANQVHGAGYLDEPSLQHLYESGLKSGINASWVALDGQQLLGFRLTQAPGNWPIDHWCSPDLWGLEQDKVCYFKCNTVEARCRGLGIGSKLLRLSVASVKRQGGQAGLAHIWLASPGNSAFKYFSKAGGKMIKEHPNKWAELYKDHPCPVCKQGCHCIAGEMLLSF